MKSLKLSDIEILAMREFYENQMRETVSKLQHVRDMLRKLGSDMPAPVIKTKSASSESQSVGKRGRKSFCGVFIREVLMRVGRPMTYEELIDIAMKNLNLSADKFSSTKQAVISSTFRMRNTPGGVRTIHSKGTRIKHVAPDEWFLDNGTLKTEYSAKLPKMNKPKKATAKAKKASAVKKAAPKAAAPKKAAAKPAAKKAAAKPAAKKAAAPKKAAAKPAAKKAAAKPAAKKAAAPKKAAAKPAAKKAAPKKAAAKPAAKKAAPKKAAAKPAAKKAAPKKAAAKPAAKKAAAKPAAKKAAPKKAAAPKAKTAAPAPAAK
jgi:hypothetical protein